MKKLLFISFLLIFQQSLFSQDLRVYHGEGSQTVFLKQNDKLENSSQESVNIVRKVNGVVTIDILNPNPFFYNYEIKTEDVDIKDDYSDQFGELIKLINSLPDNPFAGVDPALDATRIAARVIGTPPPSVFAKYQNYILDLSQDLKDAKGIIERSAHAETTDEALRRVGNSSGYGFREAIAKILSLSSSTGRFNSATLEKDLNDMLENSDTSGDFDRNLRLAGNVQLKNLYKSAFKGLNNQLLSAVKEILKVTTKDRILRFQVPVKENKQTIIKLIITPINANGTPVRDLLNREVATVLPLYVRKRFEVVPAVNLVFQSDPQKYAIQNSIVKSIPDDAAKFNIGAMALMNFASFGDFKEYGVGIGFGYSIQPGGKANSFFAMPSLSYKDIFRLGIGYGYILSPVGLTNGATVNTPLPSNISDIEDVIDYKRKSAFAITFTIAGFKF